MKTRAMTNSLGYFTPTLVITSQMSSHDERLLKQIAHANASIHQSIDQYIYEYIKVNHDGTGVPIEAVRQLQTTLSFATQPHSLRIVCIYGIDTASIPAQNALLKLLEEPPAQTQIWLTATSPAPIVPTILSRVAIVELADTTSPATEKEEQCASLAMQLPALSHRELIELADSYSEREDAIVFVRSALISWHNQLSISKDLKRIQIILKSLAEANTLLMQNVNTKLVLEHAFFTIKKRSG
jgi:DNA polymerase III delta prime subunit